MRFIYTRAFSIFFGFIVLLFIYTFLQTRGWLDPVNRIFLELPRPIKAGVSAVVNPIIEFYQTTARLPNLVKDNAVLAIRVRELETRQAQFDSIQRENQILLKELNFVKVSKYDLVRCSVLAYDPAGLTNTFNLNCGKDQGVLEGQGVVSQDRLIGKLIYVGNSISTGQFITHPSSSVDVKISRTGELGILKGSLAAGLVFESLGQQSEPQTGDMVVTAGVDSKLPGGLVVGSIDKIISENSDLFIKTSVLNSVVLEEIKYVFIVKS